MDDDDLLRVRFYLKSGNRALIKDNKCPNVKRYINNGAKITNDRLIVVEKSQEDKIFEEHYESSIFWY